MAQKLPPASDGDAPDLEALRARVQDSRNRLSESVGEFADQLADRRRLPPLPPIPLPTKRTRRAGLWLLGKLRRGE